MKLNLPIQKSGVSGVAGVQPNYSKGFQRYATETPSVAGVSIPIAAPRSATPDTPRVAPEYQREPIWDKACTPDTPDTPQNGESRTRLQTDPDPDALAEDFEERAAIIEEGDGQPRAEAERRAWRIVYCASCTHYRPDALNPEAGAGRCVTSAWERSRSTRGTMRDRFTPWPMAERLCDSWEAVNNEKAA